MVAESVSSGDPAYIVSKDGTYAEQSAPPPAPQSAPSAPPAPPAPPADETATPPPAAPRGQAIKLKVYVHYEGVGGGAPTATKATTVTDSEYTVGEAIRAFVAHYNEKHAELYRDGGRSDFIPLDALTLCARTDSQARARPSASWRRGPHADPSRRAVNRGPIAPVQHCCARSPRPWRSVALTRRGRAGGSDAGRAGEPALLAGLRLPLLFLSLYLSLLLSVSPSLCLSLSLSLSLSHIFSVSPSLPPSLLPDPLSTPPSQGDDLWVVPLEVALKEDNTPGACEGAANRIEASRGKARDKSYYYWAQNPVPDEAPAPREAPKQIRTRAAKTEEVASLLPLTLRRRSPSHSTAFTIR